MWADHIDHIEAAALCRQWHAAGITGCHDLRQRLTARARARRQVAAAIRLGSVARGEGGVGERADGRERARAVMRIRDALPEHTDYRVGGCPDLGIPSCLECDLPACRYELPSGRARALSRAAQLAGLLSKGRTMNQAAVDLGVSLRTVYRLRRMTDQPTRRPQPLPMIEPPSHSLREVFVDGRPACVRCRWAPRMIAVAVAFEMTPRGLVCRRVEECTTRQRGAPA